MTGDKSKTPTFIPEESFKRKFCARVSVKVFITNIKTQFILSTRRRKWQRTISRELTSYILKHCFLLSNFDLWGNEDGLNVEKTKQLKHLCPPLDTSLEKKNYNIVKNSNIFRNDAKLKYLESMVKKSEYSRRKKSILTLWSRSSSTFYLRIQSVPQREHHTSPLQRSTG
jgi:hypothetical protein